MNNKIEWRTVEGFDQYEVSNKGQVRHKHSPVRGKDGKFISRNRKQRKCKKGYLRIDLYVTGGIRKTIRVHSLVARAFIPNPEGKDTVNHIDLCYTNNNASNLEWMTNLENIKHSWDNRVPKKNYKPHYANY